MIRLVDEAATVAFGGRVAAALKALDSGLVVALVGELGAGKTALARATLAALGHRGAVVSPSYTLVEPYPLGARTLYHLDLYRLGDPEELELLGVREIDTQKDWLFVEWAGRGIGFLPALDVTLALDYAEPGRAARIEVHGDRGSRFLWALKNAT